MLFPSKQSLGIFAGVLWFLSATAATSITLPDGRVFQTSGAQDTPTTAAQLTGN